MSWMSFSGVAVSCCDELRWEGTIIPAPLRDAKLASLTYSGKAIVRTLARWPSQRTMNVTCATWREVASIPLARLQFAKFLMAICTQRCQANCWTSRHALVPAMS